jgi:rubredoxin
MKCHACGNPFHESTGDFMNKVKNKTEISPPVNFACGNCRLNIFHTRLRHKCILNKDLFRCSIINSCTSGKTEDEYFYFFTCPKYL